MESSGLLAIDDQVSTFAPASRRQVMLAVGLSLALVGLFVATMPFARHQTRNTEFLVPAYAAATFMLEAMTAALLFAHYKAQRSIPILLLASGYLFSALMLPAWVLTFPGVFSPLGFEFGPQATAAIAILRRLAFPLFVAAFALAPLKEGGPDTAPSVIVVTAVAVLLVSAILILRHHLPPLMLDSRHASLLWDVIPALALTLYTLDMVLLFRLGRCPLYMWVSIVLFSLFIEILLISYVGGATRLSIGWWAGRLYGLLAASVVLLFLISQTTLVHVRLARTVAAERRTREKRLTAMEALSALIAHEINQPLASMVTNADAALRWLAKSEPRLDQAEAALRRIVKDGHQASDVIVGIRTMFTKGTRERVELDIGDLVERAGQVAGPDLRLDGVEIAIERPPTCPPVIGNAVQLGHVLRNLVENAVDAVRDNTVRPRRVTIRIDAPEPDEVQVSVADNGAGISGDVADRLFDPFVTTKPDGMGMGLMFCRAVVEAHGGRIWAGANWPHGTIIRFTLPAAMQPPPEQAMDLIEQKGIR